MVSDWGIMLDLEVFGLSVLLQVTQNCLASHAA